MHLHPSFIISLGAHRFTFTLKKALILDFHGFKARLGLFLAVGS